MSIFLFLLWIICIIALFIGIIKPNLVIKWGNSEKRNRNKVFKVYGIGFVLLFILFVISLNNTEASTDTHKDTEESITENEKTSDDKVADVKVADDKVAEEKVEEIKSEEELAAEEKAANDKVPTEVPFEKELQEPFELSTGTYVIGEDLQAGKYDIKAVKGSAVLYIYKSLDEYEKGKSYSYDESYALATEDSSAMEYWPESYSTSATNVRLKEGKCLVIDSGLTVKLIEK
jgi:hypothetical protein